MARVSRWLFAECKSLNLLSFVSLMPNLPTVSGQCWCVPGPTLAFQSPWTTVCPSLESLLSFYQAVCRTVQLHLVMIWDLIDCDVVLSRWTPDAYESAGVGNAADDIIYNTFPHNECDRTCFESSPQDQNLCPSSVIFYPCPSDLGQGLGCPIDSVVTFERVCVLFRGHVESRLSMSLFCSFF